MRWWREGPVGSAPEARVDARGGDRAGAQPQPVHGLAAERVGDLDLVGRRCAASPPTRRSPPQSTAKRSRARRRWATASAARPLPVPPVSSSTPRRAADDAVRRRRRARDASARPDAGARRAAAGPRRGRPPAPAGATPASEARVARGRSAGRTVGSTRPPVRCAAHRPAPTAVRSSADAGTRGAAIAIERAQLAVGAKARQAGVEGRQPRARVVEAGAVGAPRRRTSVPMQRKVSSCSVMTSWSPAGQGRARAPARGRRGCGAGAGEACGTTTTVRCGAAALAVLGVVHLVDHDALDDHAPHEHAARRRGEPRPPGRAPRAGSRPTRICTTSSARTTTKAASDHAPTASSPGRRGRRGARDGSVIAAALVLVLVSPPPQPAPVALERVRSGRAARGATVATTGWARAGATGGAGARAGAGRGAAPRASGAWA